MRRRKGGRRSKNPYQLYTSIDTRGPSTSKDYVTSCELLINSSITRAPLT